MDKLIEPTLKIIPFARIFEMIGLNKELSLGLSAIVIAALVYFLTYSFKYFSNRYKNTKAAKDLNPYFDYKKVKSSRDLFIDTQFQNQSPTRE